MPGEDRTDPVKGSPDGRPTVAVTRSGLPGGGLDRLGARAQLRTWHASTPPTATDLAGLVAEADGLLCLGLDRIDGSVIEASRRLRVVATASVGFDNLDLAALTARHIPASNTPGVLTETTADLTWALILAASRRVVEADRFVRAGEWREPQFELMVGQDVHGGTLGIVGYGAIGRAVARRSVGFGMRVVHHDNVQAEPDGVSQWVPLEELLQTADVVSVHVTLTPETRNLIGERQLRLMKRTAVLVNAARGLVVEHDGLVRALREGWIFAAGLDAFAIEPIPPDDPLLTFPNCVVLPHIGSASAAARARMIDIAVENVLAGLAGERLPNCINPGVYG
jgi:glyoxylate reductase